MSKYYYCNMCGNEFDIWDYEEDFHIHTLLGYGTAYDGDRLHLRLCCSCMESIINNCKIDPIVEVSYCDEDYEFYDDVELLSDVINRLCYEVLDGLNKLYKKAKRFFQNIFWKTTK